MKKMMKKIAKMPMKMGMTTMEQMVRKAETASKKLSKKKY